MEHPKVPFRSGNTALPLTLGQLWLFRCWQQKNDTAMGRAVFDEVHDTCQLKSYRHMLLLMGSELLVPGFVKFPKGRNK